MNFDNWVTSGRSPRYHRRSEMAPQPAWRRKKSHAQAMTEFAIVAPILFFLLMGILESGLLLFVVGTARWSTSEVARQESESGNAANADQLSLGVLQRSAMGTTNLATVTEVDIYRLQQQVNGSLTVDGAHFNRYNLDGTSIGVIAWPPANRNVRNGQSDFLGVTVKYTYSWKTGVLVAPNAINLQQVYEIRLEPQTY